MAHIFYDDPSASPEEEHDYETEAYVFAPSANAAGSINVLGADLTSSAVQIDLYGVHLELDIATQIFAKSSFLECLSDEFSQLDEMASRVESCYAAGSIGKVLSIVTQNMTVLNNMEEVLSNEYGKLVNNGVP